MITIGYYTTDPLYSACYELLSQSLDKQGIQHDFKPIAPADWQSVIGLKPQIIKEMLEKYQQPVLYVDADAFVHKNYDSFFESLNCDLSVYWLDKKNGDKELLSGTLFFNNSEKSLQLINLWITVISENPSLNDQKCLDIALSKFEGTLAITPLPLPYIYIFDRNYEEKNISPIIEHLQASRELYLGKKLKSFKYKLQSILGIKSNKHKSLQQRINRVIALKNSLN